MAEQQVTLEYFREDGPPYVEVHSECELCGASLITRLDAKIMAEVEPKTIEYWHRDRLLHRWPCDPLLTAEKKGQLKLQLFKELYERQHGERG